MNRNNRTKLNLAIVLMALAVVTVFALPAGATTLWNPAANVIYPPAVGNWGDPCNWTNQIPGVNNGKAVFNVPGAADCWVVGIQPDFDQLVQGDGGPGGVIRVRNTGSLTATATISGWSAIGYNDTAHMIVETGGTVTFRGHLWIGADGILEIDGGTVIVEGMIGLGWLVGIGYVDVNDGGLLALSNIHGDGSSSIKGGSLLNIIGTGMVTLPGDFEAVIAAYVANGLIVGNGIVGNVAIDVGITNPGFTTVTVPGVDAGVDMITWANEPVPLNGVGGSPVVTWTSSDPNAVFSPSSTVVDPSVTVDYAAGDVTLTFEVQAGANPPVSDDMIISVYSDACEAARIGAGLAAGYPGDTDGNCIINLLDLAAEIAAKWLEDYALTAPIPIP